MNMDAVPGLANRALQHPAPGIRVVQNSKKV